MSIGTVLLQPRKVDPKLGWESALLDDLLALGMRLGWDGAHGGHALELIAQAAEAVLSDMFAHTSAGRASALQKFQALLQPIADRLTAATAGLPGESDPHEVLVGAEKVAALLSDLVNALTVEQLQEKLDQALRILSEDFGLTTDYVQQQVDALFTEAARRLRSAPREADTAARDNRMEIAALLLRVRRALHGLFVLPPLSADRLAGPLFDILRKLDFDGTTHRVGNVTTAAKDGLTAATALSDLVPFSMGFGGQGPGAAGTGSSTGKKKLWYASWVASEDIRGTDVAKDPALDGYTFKLVKPESMEQTAFYSHIGDVSSAAIFNFATGLHKGKFVNTFLQFAYYGLLTTALMIWVDYDLTQLPWWAKILIGLGTALIANFEGRWFGAGDAWLYFFRLLYNILAIAGGLPFDKLRDAVLAMMTHYNYDGPDASSGSVDAENLPKNRNKFDGLTLLLMGTAGAAIHYALMPHNFFSVGFFEKNTAGDSHHPLGTFFAAVVAGGLGISILSFFAFGTLAACLPPLWPDAKDAALTWLKGYGQSLMGFLGFFYLFNDGATDTGKRGYLPDGGRGTEAAFPGYPDPAASPYLLPFTDDPLCIQGNHGIWSHNSTRDVPLDFAYDFSMDRGAEVLCMREGTVFSAQDDASGGDAHSGVNIVIKHSSMVDGVDRDVGGGKVATYATYMHGLEGSIKAAFGRTIPAPGTAVARGKAIMKCSSTGDAWFNLLHVDVRPDSGGKPGGYTIPFVFHDADVNGDSGVPQSQRCYSSDNKKL
jgi:hypothetical protein